MDGIIDMIVMEPEPLYGPWMQVSNRKTRRSGMSKDAPKQRPSNESTTLINVSRFGILKNTDACTNDHAGNKNSRGLETSKVMDRRGESSKARDGEQAMIVEKIGDDVESLKEFSIQNTPALATKDQLIAMPSVLDPKDHSVVKIISKDVIMVKEKEQNRTTITESKPSELGSSKRLDSNSSSELDEAGKRDGNPLRELDLQVESVTKTESSAVVAATDGGAEAWCARF
ncbi:hypothetical protein V6N12_068441 [Hibiscus sabdariffa]|uniref:Uncharacterized protein n=1 Tax=Hibiscus sabdariffa TaxID=183260 RepID=A0ABR2FQQ8_9ROSI